MKAFLEVTAWIHAFIAVLLGLAALMLLATAMHTGYQAILQGMDDEAALTVIEAIGLVAVAIVSLQIAQTIAEEEVIREAHVSAPTRVRRFLSRFMVVIVIAASIEGLVATFKLLREEPSGLPYAAAIIASVGVLLAGWGWFIRCNRDAEELEPEAMEEAKSEDHKLDKPEARGKRTV